MARSGNNPTLEALLERGVIERASALATRPRGHLLTPEFTRSRLGHARGVSMSALATLAAEIILSYQRLGEPCAWLTESSRLPYAPDLASAGIDLCALPVVRTSRTEDALVSAKMLASSRAFGALVWDLGASHELDVGALSALARCARAHQCAILLTSQSKLLTRTHLDWSVQLERDEGELGVVAKTIISITPDRSRGADETYLFDDPASLEVFDCEQENKHASANHSRWRPLQQRRNHET